jgi:hypothetical protein
MTSPELIEYQALRATIRERGTARVWVFVAGVLVWASLALAVAIAAPIPFLSVMPLLVLAATFEAVFALHVGVERLGRYLQVFHHDVWEQTAMAFGAPLAGTGADPLFTLLFALATVCNFVPVIVAGPMWAEWTACGLAHALFLARLLVGRQSTARQRASDLARFQQLKREAGSTGA